MVLFSRCALFIALACLSFPLALATPLNVQLNERDNGHPQVSSHPRVERCSGARSKLDKFAKKEAKLFCTLWLHGKKPDHPIVTVTKGTSTLTIPGPKQTTITTSTVTPANAVTTFTPTTMKIITDTSTTTTTSTSTHTTTETTRISLPSPVMSPIDRRDHVRRSNDLDSIMHGFDPNVVTDACLLYLYGTLQQPVETQTGKKTVTSTLPPTTVISTSLITKAKITNTVTAATSTVTIHTATTTTETTVVDTTTTTTTTVFTTPTPTVYKVQIDSSSNYLVLGAQDMQFRDGVSNYLTEGAVGLTFKVDSNNYLQLAATNSPGVWIHEGQDYGTSGISENGIMYPSDPNANSLSQGSPLEAGDKPGISMTSVGVKCDTVAGTCKQDAPWGNLVFCPNYAGIGVGAVALMSDDFEGCGAAIQLRLVPSTD